MSKKITDSESISELESKKKSKSQEIWKVTADSIKDILTLNWDKIILTDEQIQDIINDEENSEWLDTSDKKEQHNHMLIISNSLKNLDRTKMKDFIKRKKEYLEKNRTISKERFEELFWWSGKYWKAEINQWNLWLCYAYTGFELLKKTNWFEEIIQTHLKETTEWWEVRLPFFNENWTRIKVNRDEIDKKLIFENWKKNINSKSNYLWFKILEIAFMKNLIIFRWKIAPRLIRRQRLDKERDEFKTKWDITLTYDIIKKFESKNVADFMFRVLDTKCWQGTNPIDYDLNDKIKSLIFDFHSKWLYHIELSFADSSRMIKDGKIIYKHKEQLIWSKSPDIITEKNWNNIIKFLDWHSYSIEKCYVDKVTWEKRVRVINPHHTWIKYDISLEDCKSIFKRSIIWIDIDKMFR